MLTESNSAACKMPYITKFNGDSTSVIFGRLK